MAGAVRSVRACLGAQQDAAHCLCGRVWLHGDWEQKINLGARARAGVFFLVQSLFAGYGGHTHTHTHTHQFHRATALLYLSVLAALKTRQRNAAGIFTRSPRTASAVASICDQAYGRPVLSDEKPLVEKRRAPREV